MPTMRTRIATAAAVVGAALGGGVIANAATSSSTPATTSTPAASAPADGAGTQSRPSFPAHGTAAHEALEKTVTGANATKAGAAAVAAVGGGTAGEVTTDVSGSGYEVTVTKSDGSQVEIHLDGSFTVNDHGRMGG